MIRNNNGSDQPVHLQLFNQDLVCSSIDTTVSIDSVSRQAMIRHNNGSDQPVHLQLSNQDLVCSSIQAIVATDSVSRQTSHDQTEPSKLIWVHHCSYTSMQKWPISHTAVILRGTDTLRGSNSVTDCASLLNRDLL